MHQVVQREHSRQARVGDPAEDHRITVRRHARARRHYYGLSFTETHNQIFI